MDYSIAKIGDILNAKTQGSGQVTGVSFNSRQVVPGDLFVALVADNDGHQYIQDALQRGAAAVLVDDQHDIPNDVPAVIVPDTLIALQQLGAFRRQELNPKVVAITGSNGKTTTKDMTAAVMAKRYKTFKTPENFNNEIGVPMTLLTMPADTEVLVVELGMDRPGQLTALSKLVVPDVAIITMIGEAHIEFFQTRAKIAQAKLEIVAGLKPDGVLCIPFDEPLLTQAAIAQQVVLFGDGVSAVQGDATTTTFTYQETRFAIPLIGGYNIMNALAAVSAGILLHIDLDDAVEALQTFDLTKNRTERLATAVAAVLATLKAIPAPHKYVVLGDMLELGEQAATLHANLAKEILAANVTGVYLVGQLFTANAAPILAPHFDSEHLHLYDTHQLDALIADLKTLGDAGDVILLKASHGIHLENVVNALVQ